MANTNLQQILFLPSLSTALSSSVYAPQQRECGEHIPEWRVDADVSSDLIVTGVVIGFDLNEMGRVLS